MKEYKKISPKDLDKIILSASKNKTHSYIRSKVSDGELFNFFKKYTALKAKIKDLEKELEAYKVEALDKNGPTNERIYLMETILKNAFTHMYDAYKDLLSVKPYDPDYKEGYRV